MRLLRIVTPLLCLVPAGLAQLTPDQKVADFMQLAGLYAKNYGPYEIKRDLLGYDLYNVKPWLDMINQSKTDLDYYDILTQYVGNLLTGHDVFLTPSDFVAYLHFSADVYDGKALIDSVDRSYLSRSRYPFTIGDEIVSVDGIAAADWISAYNLYANFGNPISRARAGAGFIPLRAQIIYPRAAQIGDNATVVILRQSGATETYTIPWDKTGTALVEEGPVPSPGTSAVKRTLKSLAERKRAVTIKGVDPNDDGSWDNPWGIWQADRPAGTPDAVPAYMQPLMRLRMMTHFTPVSNDGASIGNFDPLFNPPPGFKLRLGAGATDEFVSGTFPVGKYNIGYIRIPSFTPFGSVSGAESQFLNEVQYFQKNTDALIVDVMNNPGGYGCYSQDLVSFLTPYPFRGWVTEIRATQSWVLTFSSAVTLAEQSGAPQWVIDIYKSYLDAVKQALAQSRGRTGALPVCPVVNSPTDPSITIQPVTDSKGNTIAFAKPLMVLTDTYSVSSAELLTMTLQDAQRATIFGMRTDGDSGNDVLFNATDYSEGLAVVSLTLTPRSQAVGTPGFPVTPYYEGIGIYPDIVQDYMTKDNLLNGGKTFVAAFSTAISNLIQNGK